ncbi:MAG: hypothetical protein IT370_21465 [Deltaproteobacteria bacterium]|nr:hypothetical protein [Deltaproteobacteria bacterium]
MDIQPANCYARAQRLLGEIRLIGAEMGRSPDARALPSIKDAAPRECYFEALALFAKADRLNQELTGDPTDSLPHPPALAQLRPQHVLEVIDAALRELDMVKADLQLAERAAEPALEPARQPSDVLISLIDANRQLGRLLERPFTPSDVYRQVGLASTYAARLVARAGASAPAPAPFVRGKRPADCYDKLLACMTRLGAIAKAGGQTVLDVRGAPPDVLPGDVYDLANLVLGEVAFLHSLAPDPSPPYPFEQHAPGRRLPAHVHQLASTLEAQLAVVTKP